MITNQFRYTGVYLIAVNANTEGYYTRGKGGTLIKRKYGFLDKLNDLYRHGKTMDISYTFICLSVDYKDKSRILLHTGSLVGELTELLKGRGRNFQGQNSITEYDSIRDNKILYHDSRNRECSITCQSNCSEILHENYSYYDNKKKTTVLSFYEFTN